MWVVFSTNLVIIKYDTSNTKELPFFTVIDVDQELFSQTNFLVILSPERRRNAFQHLTHIFFRGLGRVKKISCLSSEIFDEIRAGGRIFILFYNIQCMWAVRAIPRPALRDGRCCSVLYVAASVTGSRSTGSAAYTWPTLTKIKTQQEYIRISCTLANQESGLTYQNPQR